MAMLISIMDELNKKSVNDYVEVASFKNLARHYGVHPVYDEYISAWVLYW